MLTGEVGFYTRKNKNTVRGADVAFISHSRLPVSPKSYGEIAPELVVEIVSPGDRAGEIETKVQKWLDFGVDMVWIVYLKSRRVHVFRGKQQPVIYTVNDALNGGTIISDLAIAVADIFQ